MQIIDDDEDGPVYALLLTPRYDEGRMQVKIGMAVPHDVDEDEEVVMTHAMTLLYAAFDLMNTDDVFLKTCLERQKELLEKFPMEDDEVVAKPVPVAKQYLDEERKVLKLDFSSPTKGRA